MILHIYYNISFFIKFEGIMMSMFKYFHISKLIKNYIFILYISEI